MGSNASQRHALWGQRNLHQERSNSAEDKGFPGTAAEARAAAERVEEEIRALGPDEYGETYWRH